MDLQNEFSDLVRILGELQVNTSKIKDGIELQLKDNPEFEELFIKGNPMNSFAKCGETISEIKQRLQRHADEELNKFPLLMDFKNLCEKRDVLCSSGMRMTTLLKKTGANHTEPIADRIAGGNLTAAIDAYVQDVEKLSNVAAEPILLHESFLEHKEIRTLLKEEKQKKDLRTSVEEVFSEAEEIINAKQQEIDLLEQNAADYYNRIQLLIKEIEIVKEKEVEIPEQEIHALSTELSNLKGLLDESVESFQNDVNNNSDSIEIKRGEVRALESALVCFRRKEKVTELNDQIYHLTEAQNKAELLLSLAEYAVNTIDSVELKGKIPLGVDHAVKAFTEIEFQCLQTARKIRKAEVTFEEAAEFFPLLDSIKNQRIELESLSKELRTQEDLSKSLERDKKREKKELKEKCIETSKLIEKKRAELASMKRTLESQRKATVTRESFSNFLEDFGSLFFSDDQKTVIRRKVEFKPGTHIFFSLEKNLWRVLAIDLEQDTALVIAEKPICNKPYNDKYESTTWEQCSLRKWLNGEYYEKTFTEAEKKAILKTPLENPSNPQYVTSGGNRTKDRIFLLSINEANEYFKDDSERKADSCWWLRSPGGRDVSAAFVRGEYGIVYGYGSYVTEEFGVRPAFRINLKSDLFQSFIKSESAESSMIQENKASEELKQALIEKMSIILYKYAHQKANGIIKSTAENNVSTYKASEELKKTLIVKMSIVLYKYAHQKANGVIKSTAENNATTNMEVEFRQGTHISFGIDKFGIDKTLWRVLTVDREQDTALLIAEKPVCNKPYNDKYESTTWEQCSLRKWLNGEYYEKTFTEAEKKAILKTPLENPSNPQYVTSGGNRTKDRIFLLSINEANEYFKDDSERKADSCWWLRSPGSDGGTAAVVDGGDGIVSDIGDFVDGTLGVRPALTINLKSDLFQSFIKSESVESFINYAGVCDEKKGRKTLKIER